MEVRILQRDSYVASFSSWGVGGYITFSTALRSH
jgi:hypothetical protein